MTIHHGSESVDACHRATRIAELITTNRWANDRVRVAFVSDLHLFTSRCDYAKHAGSVRRAVESADVCVWGGDLFDFCWSLRGGGDPCIETAIDWLDRWHREFPEKAFVYLNGNHDSQPAFQKALHDWADVDKKSDGNQSNDQTAPHMISLRPGSLLVGLDAIRIRDAVLVHGDVIEQGGHDAALHQYRARWRHDQERPAGPPKVRNGLYNAAVHARLHLATASVAHRHRRVCLRLLQWVRRQPSWMNAGMKRLAFGHTHRCLNGRRIAGIKFYNAGAAVKHVRFEPVLLDLTSTPDSSHHVSAEVP